MARMFQHEVDHLDGVLLLERLDPRPAQGGHAGPAPAGPWASSEAATTADRSAQARLRLAFLGTPEVAVAPLRALVDAGHDVALVVTRPDKQAGPRQRASCPARSRRPPSSSACPSPTGSTTCSTPAPSSGVVVAYGRLIKPARARRGADGQRPLLAAAPLAGRGAGRAGHPRRRRATGVCLMALEEGLDTGPVYAATERADRRPTRPLDELRSALVELGTRAAARRSCATGLPEPAPQEGEPTYADKLEPEEHRLDWTRPAVELHRVVRLGQAWTTFRATRLKVLPGPRWPGGRAGAGELDPTRRRVGTGDGALELVEVQPEGRGRCSRRSGPGVRGSRRASDWEHGDG